LIRNHQSATTPLTASDFALTKHAGRTEAARYKYFSSGVIYHEFNEGFFGIGSFPSFPGFVGDGYKSAHNEAVQRLYDVIRSIESPSQTGEDIGEYKQTVNLIRRPAKGILDLTSYLVNNHTSLLKKARVNNIKRVAKSLADLTLEYRYGIKPLLSTLAEATVALQNRDIISDFHRFNVKGKGVTATDVMSGWQGSGVIQRKTRTVTRTSYTVRYKGEYRTDHNVDTRSFNASLGLTWREVLPTLYNLCPYSFLLDYVVNLHSFLEVLSVPWTNVAWCNKTQRGVAQEFWQELDVRTVASSIYTIKSFSPSRYDYLSSQVVRTNQTTIPLPQLQVRYPSVKQLQNVGALVASRLPVIGILTKKLNRSSGGRLDREFKLATRDRNLRIPYPFHR
jgi:hypothetical protein